MPIEPSPMPCWYSAGVPPRVPLSRVSPGYSYGVCAILASHLPIARASVRGHPLVSCFLLSVRHLRTICRRTRKVKSFFFICITFNQKKRKSAGPVISLLLLGLTVKSLAVWI